MIAEAIAAYHIEFPIIICFVNLDLRKALGRVDNRALLETLRHYGLPDGYIAMNE